MTGKCPNCNSPLSELRELGSPPKLVCRQCGKQLPARLNERVICPVCNRTAIRVDDVLDQPGKLLFVHGAKGCLVDAPGFRTVRK